MTVSDSIIVAKGLGSFFANLGEKGLSESKRMPKNLLKKSGRALGIGANVVSAVATQILKASFSRLPKVIKIYHTGKGLYLGKFINYMLYKWNKNTSP